MTRITLVFIVAAVVVGSSGIGACGQEQVADRQYDTRVARPAYREQHPTVLFDEAHHNFHTASGLYQPFSNLVTSDGYRVTPNRELFSKDVLGSHNILVIANAAGSSNDSPDQAANAAFTAAECQAVETWVKDGGSLLLITDHYQWGAAAQNLAKRFGVGMSQGQTLDPQNSMPGMAANLIFAHENELLGNHPIIWGRGAPEQINRVVTYSGQSLLGPRGSVAFLKLADSAVDRSRVDNSQSPAAGRSQGLALIHGKGRVVVLGEAGALSAQFDSAGRPFGMNVEGTGNRQLALNIMHWLSGLIPANRRLPDRKKGSSRRSSSSSRPGNSPTSKQGPGEDPQEKDEINLRDQP
jgi:hypothetical protein